jgi:hypothetical protein
MSALRAAHVVVEEWLNQFVPAPRAMLSQVRHMAEAARRLPVKPSAQPTLVRTQHLPPT